MQAVKIVLAALLCLVNVTAATQNKSAQKSAPSPTGAQMPRQQQTKRIAPLRSSDGPEGSRVTITADAPLNDYAAYRSGDRFYVVVPGADAGAARSAVRGRGYTDAQVQRRGNDVILSFKVQPGAKARVAQRFNRLDVLIDMPGDTSRGAVTTPTPQPSPPRTTPGDSNTAARTAPSVTPVPPSNATATTTAPVRQGDLNNRAVPRGNAPNPASTTTAPLPGDTRLTQTTSGPPALTGSAPASATPPTPQGNEIAQVQAPPSTGAPTTAPAPATSSPSLGALIARNWPLALGAALLLGVGLLVAMRVGGRRGAAEPAATTAPAVTATTSRPSKSAQTKQVKKSAAEPVVDTATATTATVAATPKAIASPAVTVENVPRRVEADFAQPPAANRETAAPVAPTPSVPLATESATEEDEAAPLEKPSGANNELVQTEVARLLEGERYDASVIGSRDREVRRIVAATLMAALAGRITEKRDRARAAFVTYGHFDDAMRVSETADAPTERAAAVRALGSVRDRAATPQLIRALKDGAATVRRAAVEALIEMRDPAAVDALTALRETEKTKSVPRSLIQHAIEVSRAAKKTEAGQVSTPTAEPATVAAATPVANPPSAQKVAPSRVIPPAAERPTVIADKESVAEEVTIEAVKGEPAVVEPPAVVSPAAKSETDQRSQQTQRVAPEAEVAYTATDSAEPVAFTPEAVVGAKEITHVPAEYSEIPVETTAKNQPTSERLGEVEVPVSVVDISTKEVELATDDRTKEIEPTAGEWFDLDINEQQVAQSTQIEEVRALPVEEVTAIEEAVASDQPEPSAKIEPVETSTQTFDRVVVETHVVSEVDTIKTPPPAEAPAARERLEVSYSAETASPAETVSQRPQGHDVNERIVTVEDLAHITGDAAFNRICENFDDPTAEVRNAAALALYRHNDDHAGSFTRALREASPERRRNIGQAIAASGLATEAISHLSGESREKTYDAFSLLFLMAKAGEVQPLVRAVESHPNNEVRLAVVKLLALSGQHDILPAFRRLAVRGSLPTEVRAAVMEAIYQLSNQPASDAPHTAI